MPEGDPCPLCVTDPRETQPKSTVIKQVKPIADDPCPSCESVRPIYTVPIDDVPEGDPCPACNLPSPGSGREPLALGVPRGGCQGTPDLSCTLALEAAAQVSPAPAADSLTAVVLTLALVAGVLQTG